MDAAPQLSVLLFFGVPILVVVALSLLVARLGPPETITPLRRWVAVLGTLVACLPLVAVLRMVWVDAQAETSPGKGLGLLAALMMAPVALPPVVLWIGWWAWRRRAAWYCGIVATVCVGLLLLADGPFLP